MFKTFETFDRLEEKYKFLVEADEEVTDENNDTDDEGVDEPTDEESTDDDGDTGGDMPDDAIGMKGGKPAPRTENGDMPIDGEQGVANPENDPNIQANPEAGSFVSSLTKAKYAELLLKAFTSPAQPKSAIPKEFLEPTTNNADAIIDFVANFETLNASVATGEGSDTAEALKGV